MKTAPNQFITAAFRDFFRNTSRTGRSGLCAPGHSSENTTADGAVPRSEKILSILHQSGKKENTFHEKNWIYLMKSVMIEKLSHSGPAQSCIWTASLSIEPMQICRFRNVRRISLITFNISGSLAGPDDQTTSFQMLLREDLF